MDLERDILVAMRIAEKAEKLFNQRTRSREQAGRLIVEARARLESAHRDAYAQADALYSAAKEALNAIRARMDAAENP